MVMNNEDMNVMIEIFTRLSVLEDNVKRLKNLEDDIKRLQIEVSILTQHITEFSKK